ncbi:inositol monophosphatase family protein [Actinophytocola sp.]|uniref:inositol monophosphatase family protein n=1 Tax=Actinophytocola sp. TaxID=1872138 RepID=UPI002D6ABFA9|nr:inositol monophosphatase family protein [Actinophytocola sp.]HYQ69446.1 inositol monophosphatase family protein [Actinophytocola sp.]
MTDDLALLAAVTELAHTAGEKVRAEFSPDARPSSRADMAAVGHRLRDVMLDDLRAGLTALRPGARWVEDEQETVPLDDGEWWAVDDVEGAVNHVHGMPEWSVNVTLVRDRKPVLAVVRQPVGDLTYTAVQGGGAYRDDRPLRVGTKSRLNDALVATGQAEADQESTYRRIGESVTAMLDHALLVRMFVPSTPPMLLVASGQLDVFWQYEPVLPGVAPGILLITEAGGVVSRIDGSPWLPGAKDILVTTPALHTAAVAVLTTVA